MSVRPPPYPMDSYFDESTVSTLPESIAYAAEPYFDLSKPAGGDVNIKPGSQADKLFKTFNSMIDTLTGLHSRVDTMLSKSGIAIPASLGATSGNQSSGEQKLGKHGEILPPDSESAPAPFKQAISIAASPEFPPMAALAVIQRAPAITVSVNTFYHSSIKCPGAAAERKATNASSADVGVSLIWKEVDEPEAVISPSQSCTITSDANIARLFARLYNPDLMLSANPIAAAQVEQWVDQAAQLATASSKEQKNVLKNLNATLGKSSYAVGETLSLADYVLWAYITNYVSGSLPSNIKKWKKELPFCFEQRS